MCLRVSAWAKRLVAPEWQYRHLLSFPSSPCTRRKRGPRCHYVPQPALSIVTGTDSSLLAPGPPNTLSWYCHHLRSWWSMVMFWVRPSIILLKDPEGSVLLCPASSKLTGCTASRRNLPVPSFPWGLHPSVPQSRAACLDIPSSS